MIASNRFAPGIDNLDRLLVVGPHAVTQPWSDLIGRDYPELSVQCCTTYLSGIAEATRTPTRAVLAAVDPNLLHHEQALGGLRDAIGPVAKLILCCSASQEPLARRLVRASADDYLLYPLRCAELDRAIGYGRPAMMMQSLEPPAASMEELEELGAVFGAIDGRPSDLLERIAHLVRRGLNAQGATVIVQGSVATSGDVVVNPALAAALEGVDGVIGQLTLGPGVDGAYSPNQAEKLRRFALVASRVLEAASRFRAVRRLSETDECSGLPNRRYLGTQLDRIIERARRERFPVTVLIFDIDNFKSFNDRFGHATGDRIIHTVGDVFRRLSRPQDVVARIGGDEFAVVFWDAEGPRSPGSEPPDSALEVLDRVRDALGRAPLGDIEIGSSMMTTPAPRNKPPPTLSLTISGGLATFPWDAGTPQELMTRADEALLSAKRAGKNRIFLIGDVATR